MPLYEYRCESCERRFEFLQGMTEAPVTECPKCGGELKRLLSAPAFHLKGSGWYKTDYARGGAKPGDSQAGDAKSGEVTAGDKPADSGDSKSESAAAKSPDATSGAQPAAGSAIGAAPATGSSGSKAD
ncbi:MAG: FmdB family zinc ribbon protein [Thermoanaerobaculia bacterium]